MYRCESNPSLHETATTPAALAEEQETVAFRMLPRNNRQLVCFFPSESVPLCGSCARRWMSARAWKEGRLFPLREWLTGGTQCLRVNKVLEFGTYMEASAQRSLEPPEPLPAWDLAASI